jgi:hypothetical protein
VRRRPRRVEPQIEPAPPAFEPTPEEAASHRLREEALLMRRAQSLLRSDPTQALRLTEQRARDFPDGILEQEATVTAIDALLRLGRRSIAEERARAFERSHPGSLHARRIRRLLEAQQ